MKPRTYCQLNSHVSFSCSLKPPAPESARLVGDDQKSSSIRRECQPVDALRINMKRTRWTATTFNEALARTEV